MTRLLTTPTTALLLGFGSLALFGPRPVTAQLASRSVQVQSEHVFSLVPHSACVTLSTMQIGSNAQKAMGARAQNHNSSRSNRRTSLRAADGGGASGAGDLVLAQNHNSSRSNRGAVPMARPTEVTDDADGDGFPDLWATARIHVSEAATRGSGAEVHLQFERSEDRAISDLVEATTFSVVHASAEKRGNPLHEASAATGESVLYEGERGVAAEDEPLRTWTWALVPRAGDPDSDEDGYGDALSGAVLHVSRLGGRFHVELELSGTQDQQAPAELLGARSFRISAGQGR